MKKDHPRTPTYTGKFVNPLRLEAADVDIVDIAHSLSIVARYTGHTDLPYSVAQHSLLVSNVVPARWRLAGLLHDSYEAYISDLSHPIKHSEEFPELGEAFRALEALNEPVIEAAFGIEEGWFHHLYVKHADEQIFQMEWRCLIERAYGAIKPMPHLEAEERFLERFQLLTSGS